MLLEQLVYPSLAQLLDTSDPVAVKLELPRCKAVLDYWDKDLKAIFVSYADRLPLTTSVAVSLVM